MTNQTIPTPIAKNANVSNIPLYAGRVVANLRVNNPIRKEKRLIAIIEPTPKNKI